jgi:hypothetical protein
MKKILAIAVATAISAPAMADMTIGGQVGIVYGNDANGKAGISMDSAVLTVGATETVGETTYAVGLDFDNIMRTDGTTDSVKEAGDAYMTISNAAFGTLDVRTLESGGDYGVGGGKADDLNAEVGDSAGGANLDSIAYTLPTLVEGLGITAAYTETIHENTVDPVLDYSFSYTIADVALALNLQPTTDRVRVKASTTLAGATVAVAHEDNKAVSSRSSVGVTVPVDAASNFGLTYASYKTDAGLVQSGFAVAYDYALSANIGVVAAYKSYEKSTAATAGNTSAGSVALTVKF